MLMNTLVVTNTSQLVTVAERDVEGARGALRAIEDGALAAREGRIVWVCARALGQPYQELLARGDAGIMSTVRATRAASEDELLRLARARAQAFLRHGTTTIEAKTGYGLSPADEEKSLRVLERLQGQTPLRLVPTYLGAHLVPVEYRDDPEAYVRLL